MPKTNYKECWWLVQVVAGDLGSGGFRNGTGYSIRNLVDLRSDGGRINQEVLYDYDNIRSHRIKEEFRQSIMRWRAELYNEFGLAILSRSETGKVKGKGEGGYYYYLDNPDLLEEKRKTLKDLIKFLADSETNRDSWVTAGKIEKHYRGNASSLGFLSAGGPSSYGYLSKEGTSYRTVLGEENLEIIQFAMQFGETLTIKYGKVRTGVDINAPYTLEPYQLKEIEGRWYVIGNLFPLGHKEQAELAIYDLARLQFADEENPDMFYEPVKGFDIGDDKTLADICQRNYLYLEGQYWLINGVRTIDIMTHTEELAGYLSNHPLCSAQEEVSTGKYRIYTSLTTDTFVMLGAYGAELSFKVIPKDDVDPFPKEIENHLNFFRNTGE
jgi:hypothetical protein